MKVNQTLDADVADSAHELGLNMSRLSEAAFAEAAKIERNRRWREENRAAIDACGDEIKAEGSALGQYRSF
ncbi:type II toxin-antitoxin system CcdA family antitoxin [Pseudooceanicola sp.]|uniref:type II toxin-antitoxin system CcdA family antitoxin n=1 Tax=Pseudooceanicola sp. TaxID=1914328 RepID=UPI003514A3D0